MSAQYRPYRDEESVDGLEASWSDNDPGTVQIYEKTTEELPFNAANNRNLWLLVFYFTLIGVLGFILGLYTPFRTSNEMNTLEHSGSQSLIQHTTIQDINDKLLSKIDEKRILQQIQDFYQNNKSRVPGSEYNIQVSQNVARRLNESGFINVQIHENSYKTMMPPDNLPASIELFDKVGKSLFREEFTQFLPLCQASNKTIKTDQLLYVNRGTKEDYMKLESFMKMNDTDGKIFVIRQGFYQVYETIQTAQKMGASAVLMFPDPDVYGNRSPFPSSFHLTDDICKSYPTAWNNYGDLLSNPNLSALDFLKADKVNIPVVPINLKTAKVILRGLSGPEAPVEWNCFEFTLYIGPGYKDDVTNQDGRDEIQLDFFNEEKSITTPTVLGYIPGSIELDRYILIGSRRDSLSRGIIDSLSGTAVMLEIARVFAELVKDGWKPRRTLVFANFGAESFNSLSTSLLIEKHHKVLSARAVAYINCDLLVTGNQTVSIAASPLLFQILFNATRQVPNPNDKNIHSNPTTTVYDAWVEAHSHEKTNGANDNEKLVDELTDKLLNSLDMGESSIASSKLDGSGTPGYILHEYRKSALELRRPNIRKLDSHSMYSPFFFGLGIPIVDVRYTMNGVGKHPNSTLLENVEPFLGTKLDNSKHLNEIDPEMKYHKAVAQIITEILFDLADSVFLPFNLFDYSLTLKDGYNHFIRKHANSINSTFHHDLDSLKDIIEKFSQAAANFHHRQDTWGSKSLMNVRQINDQLMSIEKIFLDPSSVPNYVDNKHMILATNDGQENPSAFPGLADWLTLLDGYGIAAEDDLSVYNEILKVHYNLVFYTISNAIQMIDILETLSTDNESIKDSSTKPIQINKKTSITQTSNTNKAADWRQALKEKQPASLMVLDIK